MDSSQEPAMKAMAEQLSHTFHMFDMTGKGRVEREHFGTLMRSLGFNLNEEKAQIMFKSIDIERKGYITCKQFEKFIDKTMSSQDMRKQFTQAFKVMDIDEDGYITETDLKKFLQSVGESRSESQIRQMMLDADVDGDSRISFDQFVRLMMTR